MIWLIVFQHPVAKHLLQRSPLLMTWLIVIYRPAAKTPTPRERVVRDEDFRRGRFTQGNPTALDRRVVLQQDYYVVPKTHNPLGKGIPPLSEDLRSLSNSIRRKREDSNLSGKLQLIGNSS
jgi:hypothetical protein